MRNQEPLKVGELNETKSWLEQPSIKTARVQAVQFEISGFWI
jgi:hypothetical protein